MTPDAFRRWLADMQSAGLARSEAHCAELLGLHRNSILHMKRHGADRRTALACWALRHCGEPYG